jgi:hypothetical protein
MRAVRRTIALAALLAAASGCGTSATTTTSASPTTVTSLPSTTASGTAATTTTGAGATTAAGVSVTFTYAAGKVSGGSARTNVKPNEQVSITVKSDVAEEIHVHGYNKKADIAAGGSATITFNATLTGVWEVELEHSSTPLTKLYVQ